MDHTGLLRLILRGRDGHEGIHAAIGALTGLPLGQDFKSVLEAAKKHLQIQKGFNLDLTLQQWEKGYVEAALLITQGNLSQAAKLLGIHRTTLYSRMQNYGTSGEAQSPAE